MGTQGVWGPLVAASLVGLSVVTFAPGRNSGQTWRAPWTIVAGLSASLLVVWLGGMPLEAAALSKPAGLVALLAAVVLAILGSLSRARADALRTAAPTELSGGVIGSPALLKGRLLARQPVTSPGGVVCALYDAELRSVRPEGGPGRLLSRERAGADWLVLATEKGEISLQREHARLFAPNQLRAARVRGALGIQTDPAQVEGELPVDALCYERVVKLGESCLVFGSVFEEGDRLIVRGALGAQPLLIAGESVERAANDQARGARNRFAAAAALSVLAGCLLGQT